MSQIQEDCASCVWERDNMCVCVTVCVRVTVYVWQYVCVCMWQSVTVNVMCVRLELELERDKRERDARERELRERELREMELREKMKADMDLKPPGMPASKPGTVSSSVCVCVRPFVLHTDLASCQVMLCYRVTVKRTSATVTEW